MTHRFSSIVVMVAIVATLGSRAHASDLHALALYGEPRYSADFTHFAYANPNAPKGGRFKTAAIGQFDNFNPFILKGIPANGLNSYLFETLLTPSYDEAASHYGLIARSVTVSPNGPNGQKITFHIRTDARFHDGAPITAADVQFSFDTLMEKGHPFFRFYYRDVEKVTTTDPSSVTFHLAPNAAKELPLIIGSQLPILAKHFWQNHDFSEPLLTPPISSGPYRISDFAFNQRVIYTRDENYWGRHLAVNQGRHNFDTIHIDYYRDATVALEGFRSHAYDFRAENQAKAWAHGYAWDDVTNGFVIVEEIPHQIPTGMQGFVFNTRKTIFRDSRVRQALILLYDFAWANRNLFHNAYTRSTSYFSNSELAARGEPSPEEKQLLKPFAHQLPPETLTSAYEAPVAHEKNGMRPLMREARRLLQDAGWSLNQQKMTHQKTGDTLQFEILLRNPQFERVVAPYIQSLKRLGIDARLRLIQDDSQYQKKLDDFDFDMVVSVFPASITPGNELRDLFSSQAADTSGSRNLAGIRHEAVDSLVERIITADDRAAVIVSVKALDRVLLWNHYVVPHWHIGYFRIAWWNMFSRPAIQPPYNLALDFWWYDQEKAASIP